MPEPIGAPESPRRIGPTSLLKRASAVAIGLLIGLLLAEVAVRLFAHFAGDVGRRLAIRDPLAIVYQPYGEYGYRPTPGRAEKFYNGTRANYNALGTRGPLVSIPKPAGVYRIILLGGSTMAGYGVNDDETIDAYMRRLLPARFPGRCFEVVNLALGGYDSYQDFERMRVDGVPLKPDLVVVHSGINDVRNARYRELTAPPDHRTLIWEVQMSRIRQSRNRGRSPWAVVKHYSYLARLPGFVWELSRQGQELHVIQEVGPYDAAVDYFETNVERTIALGLDAGAAVLLSHPPSALSMRNRPTDPVEKSYWIRDAGTTEAYRERLGARMREMADRDAAAGKRVGFVSHQLPLEQFIDDAHLNRIGNETVARNLVDAAAVYISESPPPDGAGACQ